MRLNVNGSQLYEMGSYVNEAVPLKKTKILIGAYLRTLVPAFLIVPHHCLDLLEVATWRRLGASRSTQKGPWRSNSSRSARQHHQDSRKKR